MKKNSNNPKNESRKPTTPLQRVGQVGLSILNPFSDLAVIYRRGAKPTIEKLRLLAGLVTKKSDQPEADAVGTSWATAVAQSGRSVTQLISSYTRIQTAWWFLMFVSGGMALLLLVMILFTRGVPAETMARAGIATVLLASVSAVGFVKSLIATYRLWQLQQKRVSVTERGTFKDFLAETRWCRQVLTMGHFK